MNEISQWKYMVSSPYTLCTGMNILFNNTYKEELI